MPSPSTSAAKKTWTLGFRADSEQMAVLTSFFETFPDAPQASGFRWIIDHPTVRSLIAERIRDSYASLPAATGGEQP